MRFSIAAVVMASCLAACSGGGASAPKPSAAPIAGFEPSSITVHAANYDYFGVFEYSASADAQPKPIDPANGSLACNDGYSVPLQLRAGPDQIGLVRDQYIVLPLLASPPAGTTLTCTSKYGIFDASGTLVASNTLEATIIYDETVPAIAFSPAKAKVFAKGTNAPIYLDYTNATGYSIQPTSPPSLTLSCPKGYAPSIRLAAGPGMKDQIEDQLIVNTASIAPPKNTKLACSATYGLYDPTQTLVAKATLDVTLVY